MVWNGSHLTSKLRLKHAYVAIHYADDTSTRPRFQHPASLFQYKLTPTHMVCNVAPVANRRF